MADPRITQIIAEQRATAPTFRPSRADLARWALEAIEAGPNAALLMNLDGIKEHLRRAAAEADDASQAAQPQQALEVPAYSWPPKACPCGPVQGAECADAGCRWERDSSLVPVELRVQAQQPAQQTDLHAAIMNLPCSASKYDAEPNLRLAYKIGHRAARHQAAELVAAAPQQPAQQVPLTDKAILEANYEFGIEPIICEADADIIRFARAIEAAHGIELSPAAKEGEKKQ
jgi:hypothetical protein